MKLFVYPLFLLSTLAAPMMAHASTSEWSETPGGRVRLLVEDGRNSGEIRGALQIDLKSGWKTYWQNPGDSGVPPQINTEDQVHARIHFPAPDYFEADEEGGIGYKQAVTLPITFTLNNDMERLKGSAFLGVCDNICIPVMVEFDLSLLADKSSHENIATRTIIESAFDHLPTVATSAFGVESVHKTDSGLVFDIALPERGVPAELFVASNEISLSSAHPYEGKDNVFVAKTFGKIRPNAVIDYTLTQNGKSVSGTLRLD